MKRSVKFAALSMALAMVLSLAACSKAADETTTAETTETTTTAEATTEITTEEVKSDSGIEAGSYVTEYLEIEHNAVSPEEVGMNVKLVVNEDGIGGAASQLVTKAGIRVGSSVEEVLAAYGRPDEFDETHLSYAFAENDAEYGDTLTFWLDGTRVSTISFEDAYLTEMFSYK